MPLRQLDTSDLSLPGNMSLDHEAYQVADRILTAVRREGQNAVRRYANEFDGMRWDAPLCVSADDLHAALNELSSQTRELLERTADRIRRFAETQREAVRDCQLAIPGGTASHRWIPLKSAGCYAPSGRYPLPSSLLMTAVTARVAGVAQVWVASPNPTPATLAAAAIAKVDGMVCVGGAQGIGALAYGVGSVPACDIVVGPGNRFVTAAKALISRSTKIDALAGPSELVVAASQDANPDFVAADLLGQAEHDPLSRTYLITNEAAFAGRVVASLEKQLATTPTRDIAEQALANGGYLVVESMLQAQALCERIAPEHLSLQGREFEDASDDFTGGATVFLGSLTAAALGDYGGGPNHVLPTGGTARYQSGLSVISFLRYQTQLQVSSMAEAEKVMMDAQQFATLEQLPAHAASIEQRMRAAKLT